MPDLPPVPAYGAATLATTRYQAVLVAGDSSLPVFDNAVDAMQAKLRAEGGLSGGRVQRLSTAPAIVAQDGVRSASLDHTLDAVSAMRPGAGQGCLVFATSHGIARRGLRLGAIGEVLSPTALDAALVAALVAGCGNVPTAVVISGCFSGDFAQAPMARPNRVVLTASRPDRASFGCGAGRQFTVYDRCLLDAMTAGALWTQVHYKTKTCVSAEEVKGGFTPSEPQIWAGAAVAALTVPGSAATR